MQRRSSIGIVGAVRSRLSDSWAAARSPSGSSRGNGRAVLDRADGGGAVTTRRQPLDQPPRDSVLLAGDPERRTGAGSAGGPPAPQGARPRGRRSRSRGRRRGRSRARRGAPGRAGPGALARRAWGRRDRRQATPWRAGGERWRACDPPSIDGSPTGDVYCRPRTATTRRFGPRHREGHPHEPSSARGRRAPRLRGTDGERPQRGASGRSSHRSASACGIGRP